MFSLVLMQRYCRLEFGVVLHHTYPDIRITMSLLIGQITTCDSWGDIENYSTSAIASSMALGRLCQKDLSNLLSQVIMLHINITR